MNYLLCTVAYNLFDDGLANFLGVETLRHGTNLVNYIGISLLGGLPSHAGKLTGSTPQGVFLVNKFYVFKDSEFSLNDLIFSSNPFLNNSIAKRMFAKGHLGASGYFSGSYLIPGSSELLRHIMGVAACIFNLLVTPTLKFRYALSELGAFVNDPAYGNAAYYTTKPLPFYRLGITGSLVSGVNKQWLARSMSNPYKLATGTVQLALAVAIVAYILYPKRNEIKNSLLLFFTKIKTQIK